MSEQCNLSVCFTELGCLRNAIWKCVSLSYRVSEQCNLSVCFTELGCLSNAVWQLFHGVRVSE